MSDFKAATNNVGSLIDCDIYDNALDLQLVSYSGSQVNYVAYLLEGKSYFIDIYNNSKTIANYTFEISY